jgi:hypothetical protein
MTTSNLKKLYHQYALKLVEVHTTSTSFYYPLFILIDTKIQLVGT